MEGVGQETSGAPNENSPAPGLCAQTPMESCQNLAKLRIGLR